MRHVKPVTQLPSVAANTITIKLQGMTDIIDRLLLAQRQFAWKTPFPPGGSDGDGGVDTGGDDDGGGIGF